MIMILLPLHQSKVKLTGMYIWNNNYMNNIIKRFFCLFHLYYAFQAATGKMFCL